VAGKLNVGLAESNGCVLLGLCELTAWILGLAPASTLT